MHGKIIDFEKKSNNEYINILLVSILKKKLKKYLTSILFHHLEVLSNIESY